jgi:hypothetical protein
MNLVDVDKKKKKLNLLEEQKKKQKHQNWKKRERKRKSKLKKKKTQKKVQKKKNQEEKKEIEKPKESKKNVLFNISETKISDLSALTGISFDGWNSIHFSIEKYDLRKVSFFFSLLNFDLLLFSIHYSFF